MTKVNMSGEIVDEADAKISVFDHGLLYGDGIFEGIRIYNRCIFKYSEHIDRLYDSARAISLTIPISKQTFQDEIIKTCIENKIDSGYLRVIVTRGIGGLGVSSITCKNPQYIIISKEVDPLHGAKSVEDGVDVITTSIRRASKYVNSCSN